VYHLIDDNAPIMGAAATRLEILRRTRVDFNVSPEPVLREIRRSVPDATEEEFAQAADSPAVSGTNVNIEEPSTATNPVEPTNPPTSNAAAPGAGTIDDPDVQERPAAGLPPEQEQEPKE
jgi:hypothetical protein